MTERNPEHLEKYYEELSLRLRLEGFSVSRTDNGGFHVAFDDAELCEVTEDGVRYHQKDISPTTREQAKDRVLALSKQIREYITAFLSAPTLKAESLDENYKVLLDYHDTVLAARSSKYGMQFVTWDWNFNHTGLNHGHYHDSNYENAKRDFAVRAGLVEHQPVFNQKQLVEIYRCCEDTLCGTYKMADDQRKIIRSIQDTIREKHPDILDLIHAHDEAYEEAMYSSSWAPEQSEETEIDIMWDDLKPSTQKRILNMLGENGNYDVYPIATIQAGQTMEQTM